MDVTDISHAARTHRTKRPTQTRKKMIGEYDESNIKLARRVPGNISDDDMLFLNLDLPDTGTVPIPLDPRPEHFFDPVELLGALKM